MLTPPPGLRVLIATKPVDFRKGADGLAALAKEVLGQDPLSGVALRDDPPRRVLDPLGVGDRGPAELHHDGGKRGRGVLARSRRHETKGYGLVRRAAQPAGWSGATPPGAPRGPARASARPRTPGRPPRASRWQVA